MCRLAFLLAGIGLSFNAALQAGEIGFAEEFALAKDRAEALKKLIPGTEDYYYYHCLALPEHRRRTTRRRPCSSRGSSDSIRRHGLPKFRPAMPF